MTFLRGVSRLCVVSGPQAGRSPGPQMVHGPESLPGTCTALGRCETPDTLEITVTVRHQDTLTQAGVSGEEEEAGGGRKGTDQVLAKGLGEEVM
jgi:hypothetical protein